MINRKKPHILIIEQGEKNRPEASVLVIDVIRAFTCTALAFENGVENVLCVEGISQAIQLKKIDSARILMGEERGLKPDGFDFGNSPLEISQASLHNKELIQRTSNGTRGLIAARFAQNIWATSAINVDATIESVMSKEIQILDLVITDSKTSEDRACANYILRKIYGQEPNPADLSKNILIGGQEHKDMWNRPRTDDEIQSFQDDVVLCAQVNLCDFAMHGELTAGNVILLRKSN